MARAKPLTGTWYAVKAKGYDLWWPDIGAGGVLASGFAGARLYTTREAAIKDGKKIARGYEIVDVRCRTLSTKAKASKKRTR